jgi:ATP-binding cassette subfamily F protein uup
MDPRQAKKDLARLERQLDKLTQREERLHVQLAEHATDYAKVAELDEALRALTAERAALEEQWLVLADEV